LRRVVLSCLASLALYFALFATVLDRPLSNGFLSHQIDTKLARGAAIEGVKLVILAGSNGPYSHRCETIAPIIGRPCVNAGVAVGIGLDYLFARWEPLLRPGDAVYLPMESTQYSRARLENTLGPDAAILFRHDWATLSGLAPDRWLGAAFAFDLRALVMSGIEVLYRRDVDTGENNASGDRVGHIPALGVGAARLLAMHPVFPTDRQIAFGYGTALIAGFTERMSTRGVVVIGGLSTHFADTPLSDPQIAAMQAAYTGHGGRFLMLDNRSGYPRSAFFDSSAHLNETAQILHSQLVGMALLALLKPTSADQVIARAASAGSVVPP
jgi:hypothetical protein